MIGKSGSSAGSVCLESHAARVGSSRTVVPRYSPVASATWAILVPSFGGLVSRVRRDVRGRQLRPPIDDRKRPKPDSAAVGSLARASDPDLLFAVLRRRAREVAVLGFDNKAC